MTPALPLVGYPLAGGWHVIYIPTVAVYQSSSSHPAKKKSDAALSFVKQ